MRLSSSTATPSVLVAARQYAINSPFISFGNFKQNQIQNSLALYCFLSSPFYLQLKPPSSELLFRFETYADPQCTPITRTPYTGSGSGAGAARRHPPPLLAADSTSLTLDYQSSSPLSASSSASATIANHSTANGGSDQHTIALGGADRGGNNELATQANDGFGHGMGWAAAEGGAEEGV